MKEFASTAVQHMARITNRTELRGACLYAAMASVLASADYGIPALFCAGSAQWRRLPAELDDGIVDTHFAFMWEPTSAASLPLLRQLLALLVTGNGVMPAAGRLPLPEVHCWAYWPDSDEVVDLTTGSLAEQCDLVGGRPWLTPSPPTYLIGRPDPDTRYTMDRQATQLMLRVALATLKGHSAEDTERFVQHLVTSENLLQELQQMPM